MDLQREYDKLYQHWLEEFQQTEMTELKPDILRDYNTTLNSINDYTEENINEIKASLLKSYKENINFLYKDFLKMRENKIINSALAMREINLENLIEAEKLLYQNLVSSIKGYKKVKKISKFGEELEINLKKGFEPVLETKTNLENVTVSDKQEISSTLELHPTNNNEILEYTLVRFLKKTPPLVGIDLINYGPFEEEDIANLPQKNAKILIIEKFAEKIELN